MDTIIQGKKLSKKNITEEEFKKRKHEYYKEWIEKHKDDLKRTCECGITVDRRSFCAHKRSKLHSHIMNALQNKSQNN